MYYILSDKNKKKEEERNIYVILKCIDFYKIYYI